ncbi:hypothetical protein [Sulfobacillus sp. hq2]|uniref:hypothetical protein n=1 Tax=Sulfobacillus sp. hq2 TaxID=2039167 RepID=UPI000CD1DA13|nr:hypothetical protein [Sulfobacillus sp. hq2]POB09607.1 hypothetical protein CO251_15475 [Sulfobacillus sp. hq2]
MKTRVLWMTVAGLAALLTGCGNQPAASPPVSTSQPAKTFPISPDHLVLSPSHGAPGAMVTAYGNLPHLAHDTRLPNETANVVIGSWTEGFQEQGLPVTWSKAHPGYFFVRFRMPAVPWITPHGAHPLKDGPVSIGIQCLGEPVQGCGLKAPTMQAPFDLTGPIPKAPSHAVLHLHPDHGAAGTVIHVSGWAPLTTVIGEPFGYELDWQEPGKRAVAGQLGQVQQQWNGDLTGTFQVPAFLPSMGELSAGPATLDLAYVFVSNPQSALAPLHSSRGAGFITIAPTQFVDTSSPEWSNLAIIPRHIASNQNGLSFAAPTPLAVNGQHLVIQSAYHGPLWQSYNGGQSWQPLSLQSLIPLSNAAGFPAVWPGNSTSVQATSITLDPAYPHSLFVAFSGVLKKYDQAPPVYNLPAFSTNAGGSWQLVPVPSGMVLGDFGGFYHTSQAVYALFSNGSLTETEETSNGGQSWSQQSLSAAVNHATLIWGAVPNQNNGQMGGFSPQLVLYKNNQGDWTPTAHVGLLEGPSDLVRLPHHQALLVSSSTSYPVQFSRNGGKTWQNIQLPTPPGATTQQSPYQTLQLLPSGSLLADVIESQGPNAWFVLPPHAQQWQPVPVALPQNTPITVGNKGIWWNSSSAESPQALPIIHHVLDKDL